MRALYVLVWHCTHRDRPKEVSPKHVTHVVPWRLSSAYAQPQSKCFRSAAETSQKLREHIRSAVDRRLDECAQTATCVLSFCVHSETRCAIQRTVWRIVAMLMHCMKAATRVVKYPHCTTPWLPAMDSAGHDNLSIVVYVLSGTR